MLAAFWRLFHNVWTNWRLFIVLDITLADRSISVDFLSLNFHCAIFKNKYAPMKITANQNNTLCVCSEISSKFVCLLLFLDIVCWEYFDIGHMCTCSASLHNPHIWRCRKIHYSCMKQFSTAIKHLHSNVHKPNDWLLWLRRIENILTFLNSRFGIIFWIKCIVATKSHKNYLSDWKPTSS